MRKERRRTGKAIGALLVFGVFVFLVASVIAAGPGTITYQGRVKTKTGAPPADGNYKMHFSLWTGATGGSYKWFEVHEKANAVPVAKGVFSVQLGSQTPIPDNIFKNYAQLWLMVQIDLDGDGNFAGESYSPRAPVSAAPYAIQSDNAFTLVEAGGSNTLSISGGTMEGSASSSNAILDVTNTGTGRGINASVAGVNSYAIYGEATNTGSGANFGGNFHAASNMGRGVLGQATGFYGIGVAGDANNTNTNAEGIGVYGSSTSDKGKGVSGWVSGKAGIGVKGEASATGESVHNYGGYFIAGGWNGEGVYGESGGLYGYGVHGKCDGKSGRGGYFTAAGNAGRAVYGYANNTGDVTNYGGYFSSTATFGRGCYGKSTGDEGYGVYGEATSTSDYPKIPVGVYGKASADYGRGVEGYATGIHGVGVRGESTGNNGHGVVGWSRGYGAAIAGVSTGDQGEGVWGQGSGDNSTGVMGTGKKYDFYANGDGINYASFTGGHDVQLADDFPTNLQRGMIVAVTGKTQTRLDKNGKVPISDTLPTVKLANKANDKAVFGIFMMESPLPDVHWHKAKDGERFGTVNALGEGRVWVCDAGGELEAGDYITTSDVPGYGQLQSDDVLHSYTLGKAIETVDWDAVTETVEHNGKTYKVYLIAVVYTSG